MIPEVRQAVRAKARAEVRLIYAASYYRLARGHWHETRAQRDLLRAVAARARLSECLFILREPTPIEQRAEGIDADELAVMAGVS